MHDSVKKVLRKRLNKNLTEAMRDLNQLSIERNDAEHEIAIAIERHFRAELAYQRVERVMKEQRLQMRKKR